MVIKTKTKFVISVEEDFSDLMLMKLGNLIWGKQNEKSKM